MAGENYASLDSSSATDSWSAVGRRSDKQPVVGGASFEFRVRGRDRVAGGASSRREVSEAKPKLDCNSNA